MRTITLIKSYNLAKAELPFDAERAIADFRAFEPLALVHSARVCHEDALQIMLAVVDGIRDDLLAKRNSLQQRQESVRISVI